MDSTAFLIFMVMRSISAMLPLLRSVSSFLLLLVVSLSMMLSAPATLVTVVLLFLLRPLLD